jgi:hypothetical protein
MSELVEKQMLGKLPEPLGDMPGLAVNDQLIVFGGGSGDQVRDSILAIDGKSGVCRKIGQMPYPSRGHQAVYLHGHVYILGGFDQGTKDDLWRLDLESGKAEKLRSMPASNAWFAAVGFQDSIAVVGGYSIPGAYLDHIDFYDPGKDQWRVVPNAFDAAIFSKCKIGSNAVLVHDDSLFSFGGADYFNNERGRANGLNIAARYNVLQNNWESLPQAVHPREGLVAIQVGTRGYLIGGMAEDESDASVLIEQVILPVGYIQPIGQLTQGRLTPAAGIIGRRLVIAGGVIQPLFQMTDTIEYFDLES